MIINNPIFPRFISNAPIGEDQFVGQAQKKIADAIADLYSQDSAASKIIGLDGGWGSGKSNVVEIIKTTSDSHVFIFDAWGHQEDDMRRSILEELTEELSDAEMLTDDSSNWKIYKECESWADKLKRLNAKYKETDIKHIPKISPIVFWAGLAIILTPIIGVMVDATSCVGTKIILSIIPFVLLIIALVIVLCSKKTDRGVSNLYYLFQEERDEEKTCEVISEEEPSVKQFRLWMEDLSGN